MSLIQSAVKCMPARVSRFFSSSFPCFSREAALPRSMPARSCWYVFFFLGGGKKQHVVDAELGMDEREPRVWFLRVLVEGRWVFVVSLCPKDPDPQQRPGFGGPPKPCDRAFDPLNRRIRTRTSPRGRIDQWTFKKLQEPMRLSGPLHLLSPRLVCVVQLGQPWSTSGEWVPGEHLTYTHDLRLKRVNLLSTCCLFCMIS